MAHLGGIPSGLQPLPSAPPTGDHSACVLCGHPPQGTSCVTVYLCVLPSLPLPPPTRPPPATTRRPPGVVANTAYLAQGLKFSWPTYKSGLSLAVTGHTKVGGAGRGC